MECRNCPYIKEEVERMVSEYYQYPGAYLPENKIADWLAEQRWCDKVGGKISHFGRCEDAYTQPLISQNRSKQKRRNKRERDQKHKNHLKFLAENVQYYPPSVIYIDEIYVEGEGWVDNLKPYYKRCYRDKHKGGRYKFYKKYSNRCVRRYKGEIHIKGNYYRKVFDYWWTVD